MKTFKVVTLGCRTNQYESQAYADQLRQMGYSAVDEGDPADLCIVNTCTVTASADSSSRYQIRHLARENPGASLVVTGCLAEKSPDEIRAMEGVTHLVRNAKKEQLLEELFPEKELPEFAIRSFDDHTRAFVKVQDGCNSYCTYCILPYVRGRSRSRPVKDILKEVEQLVANGYKEVVLTGINIGDFDGAPSLQEKPWRLADLVRAVDAVQGLQRLRVSSIDPDEVDDDFIRAILEGKTTCHSLHVVLQAGSNVILKRMNRKYTRQIFLDTIRRLRSAAPDFGFTTDVIVGFPGETETDFRETLDVLHEVLFAKVHMFPYSPRERTRAALYPNQIAPLVMQQRKQEILRASESCAFHLRAPFVGRTMQVLVESSSPVKGFFLGHTTHFLPVFIPKEQCEPNQIVDVLITENAAEGLFSVVNSCGVR